MAGLVPIEKTAQAGGGFFGFGREGGEEERFEGLLDHPVHNVVGGVKGARGISGDGAGLWVVGGEEVFEDVAEKVGI